MPSQHKTTPLSIRLPDAERQRLYDYAERRGLPVRRVITDAIREKLDREGAEVIGYKTPDGRIYHPQDVTIVRPEEADHG